MNILKIIFDSEDLDFLFFDENICNKIRTFNTHLNYKNIELFNIRNLM